MTTRSQEIAADISALLRARHPLLWIVTREEARAERYLFEAAALAGYIARTWDIAQGVANIDGKPRPEMGDRSPDGMLAYIQDRADPSRPQRSGEKADRGVWIMRDLPVWLAGPTAAPTLRLLRNLTRSLPSIPRETAQAIIVISPDGNIPPELSGHATVIEWPLPDRAEIAAVIDAAINSLPEFETDPATKLPDPTKPLRALAAPNGTREAAIDAAVGLSGEEASSCYARSLVQLRKIDPVLIATEKRRVIARERVLEWYDPLPGGLEAVGGLENLKAWLLKRSTAYSAAARAYGLPLPKGMMLVGVPGCGKSLTAKAVSTAWGMPLLKLDLGALKDKFVGSSEANLRKALRVIETIGRCVVWLDEIEKALQGATSGAADGGVSADALGAVLSWMQERQGGAFVIATANDVTSLPPELLRKGRFDEVWFIDLPTLGEREAVIAATLRSFMAAGSKVGLGAAGVRAVAEACEGFTGSELAALVPDAMFAAFSDGARELRVADLLEAAETVTPLSQTASEKITKLREWGKTRARMATRPDDLKLVQGGKQQRVIEV